MKAPLRKYWGDRTPRQRLVIVVAGAVAGVAAYLWLLYAADHARSRLRTSVALLSAQATSMDQRASEYERLRSAPRVVVSSADLRVLIQAQAGAAGLSRLLQRVETTEPDRVQVVFGAVAFADWLNWVQSLQSLQIRLDACRIEAFSTAGLVNVTATFVRPALQ